MNVLNLATLKDTAVELVGSKARNLGEMLEQGLPVPHGFVVTVHAFQAFLEENGLSASDEDAFLAAPIPASIVEEIRSHYDALHRHAIYAVAVRSSSALEDLNNASFAGQYETYLNVRSFDDLLLHIKRCWFSYFSPIVQEYAKNNDIALDGLAMGVLVQGMVDADVSGVIFSKNPVTNSADEIVINASYGLGEAIVSGLATPDFYTVSKRSGEISAELGLKELKIIPTDSGTEEVETTPEEQDVFCLSDDLLQSLVDLTRWIERLHEGPVDIEFAIKDGVVHLLQVRPITT